MKQDILTMVKVLQRCAPGKDRDHYQEWMQAIIDEFDYPTDTRFASRYY